MIACRINIPDDLSGDESIAMATISGISRLARLAILSTALLGCGARVASAQRIGPAAVAPATPVDPLQLFDDALGKLQGTAAFAIGAPADGQAFSQRPDGTITVDRHMVSLIRTPEEALALAVVLQTYAVDSPKALRTKDSVSAGEIVAGLLAGGVASSVDNLDTRNRYISAADRQARDKQHALGWAPRASEAITPQQVQATRTLTVLDKAGGCSGPLAAILGRIASDPGSAQTAGTRVFARSVLRDLGAYIQPPETSCVRRR